MINITTQTNSKVFVLKIEDQGIGIPEREQKRLFERFFRAENAFNVQGTGLGLCIVAKYVELMHGTIHVDSKENWGSTFIIKLPVITETSNKYAFASCNMIILLWYGKNKDTDCG
jgi:signal transduction histidine kinase